MYAIICCNVVQTIFEAALLYTRQVTFYPTKLEKLQNPEAFDDNEADPDKRPEPNCSTVMAKCWTEMLYICLYIIITFLTLCLLMECINTGKPMTVLVEFCIGLFID